MLVYGHCNNIDRKRISKLVAARPINVAVTPARFPDTAFNTRFATPSQQGPNSTHLLSQPSLLVTSVISTPCGIKTLKIISCCLSLKRDADRNQTWRHDHDAGVLPSHPTPFLTRPNSPIVYPRQPEPPEPTRLLKNPKLLPNY